MALQIRHLEEYHSGTLQVNLGGGLAPIVISGTGWWSDETDYQRLRRRRDRPTRAR